MKRKFKNKDDENQAAEQITQNEVKYFPFIAIIICLTLN